MHENPAVQQMTICQSPLAFSHTLKDIHLYQSSSHRKLFGNRTLSPEYKRINSGETTIAIEKSPDHVIVKKKGLGEFRWQVFRSKR
jgi:hypothetical protein